MKKLRLLIVVFSLALCIPLAYFVLSTYRGLAQEEVATLRYFTEALFDEMEQSLAALVQLEEGRAIDEYNYFISPLKPDTGSAGRSRSPLSNLPQDDFILGYFQNNPDGSFQTPIVESGKAAKADKRALVEQLKNANINFNQKRVTATDKITPAPPKVMVEAEKKRQQGFADKYLDTSRAQKSRDFLGQTEKRVEKITVGQALNVAKQELSEPQAPLPPAENERPRKAGRSASRQPLARAPSVSETLESEEAYREDFEKKLFYTDGAGEQPQSFQVEVAPLQSVFINDDQIFIFRRIMINSQIYRQGFVLKVNAFLEHLTNTYFISQPMARYTNLRLTVQDQGRETRRIVSGVSAKGPKFILNRSFPSPFSFLNATLACDQIPRSTGRRTLTIMVSVLAVVVLIGLFAIYQSARAIVDLSERRSQFVSSVTHELKTPLTNIRMYIEMLEQGIARSPEREQEYFSILDSEGARLSRLINNVLELSKLEKRQRRIDLQTGTFEDVIEEVQSVMREKLRQEGFVLRIDLDDIQPFSYDREVMIQVLINLIENSMKFGNSSPTREITIRVEQNDNVVSIGVSDTGPGIPGHALKKVFNDFYRADNSLTRNTRGTGIGLALVKKFVNLMGGTVSAKNNDGPGCTITISLPG
jgi:signal transduction histidine kinase